MSGYTITHTDEYDPETNKAEGKIFRNKDEVISYLTNMMAMISSDSVQVHKR
jgi:hypothetical protein